MSGAAMSEGPTVRPVAPQERELNESPDFRAAGIAEQAAFTIEGEDYARACIERLRADSAEPDELAVLLAFLHGPMLRGACRVIEKELRGRHV